MLQNPYNYIIYRNDLGSLVAQPAAQPSDPNDPSPDQIQTNLESDDEFLNNIFAEFHWIPGTHPPPPPSGSILIKAGDYDITAPLDLQWGLSLTFEPGATLYVPSGYSGVVLRIRSNMFYVHINGGFIRERDRQERRWVGLLLHQNVAPTEADGIAYCVIDGLRIQDADVGILLHNDHEQGWINGNTFRDLVMWRCNGFIDFNMELDIDDDLNEEEVEWVPGSNGFSRNLFLNIIGQSTANTEFGVRNIRHRGNAFGDVKIWDIQSGTANAFSASIHDDAENTLILGGIMTNQNFVDDGLRTQLIDLFDRGRLYLRDLDVERGDILVRDNGMRRVFHLDSSNARLLVGAEGNEGEIEVRDFFGRSVFLFASAGVGPFPALLRIGNEGNRGHLIVMDEEGQQAIHLDGHNAQLDVGGLSQAGSSGHAGDIQVRDGQGRTVFFMDGSAARLRIGTQGHRGQIVVRNNQGDNTVVIRGQTGVIECTNCDTAEDFEVVDIGEAKPGTVMIINDGGQLCASSHAYDKRVAGVLSGAENMRPGIILGRSENSHNKMPLALNGRVYCKADAQYGQIEVGDLLTTSPTSGHAMKVTDPDRAFGAVIGKALRPLLGDCGLIPILVSLQ